ncbi:MAG: NUDIX domain-containing protein [Patescibacteria group bacterium]|nr:NUDIX domain-containing protein [Patescibacteria group bacterium]
MKTKYEISAGGIVFKNTKERTLWLICQHSQHKGWVFPKGLIADKKNNELMEEAALREVEEEGGVKAKIVYPKPIKVFYQYQWKNSPHGGKTNENILVKKTVYYFLMEYLSGDPKNHDWEMSDAKFLTEKEIKKTLSYSSDKKAFNEILKLKKILSI